MPASAGGRSGKCPHCRSELIIAHDLEGLWLPSEYSDAANDAAPIRVIEKNSGERRWLAPLRPLHWLALAGSLLAIVGVAMFSTAPRDVALTLPRADAPVAVTGTASPQNEANQADPIPGPPEPPPASEAPAKPASATSPALPSPTDIDPLATTAPAQVPTPALPTTPPAPPMPDPSPAAEAAAMEQTAWQQRAARARDHFDATVRWVLVDDRDNEADPVTSLGKVSENFYIAQYELTNADYCVYLNASKAGRDDWREVGRRAIEPGAIVREQLSGSDAFEYSPAPGMAQKPVSSLSPADALRLANWLHNLAASQTDEIDTGAYDLGPDAADQITASRSPDARFFVPTLDEWYKAAYFKRGKRKAEYWRYPTATNEPLLPRPLPTPHQRTLQGIETTANFGAKPPDLGLAQVGSSGAASAYDAFDMGGNAAEWAADVRAKPAGLVACGGSWESPLERLDREAFLTLGNDVRGGPASTVGVRLARSIPAADTQLTADSAPRVGKEATYTALRVLQTALDDKFVRTLPNANPRAVDAVATRLGNVDPQAQPAIHAEVMKEVLDTRALLAKAKMCCERKARAREAVPQANLRPQLAADPLQAVGQLVDGLQAEIKGELKRDAILEECNTELARIQRDLSATKERLKSLRPPLEAIFGKP